MIDITGAVGIAYLGVRRHAKVSEVVIHNEWCIRGKQSRRYHSLYDSILALEVLSNDKGNDVVLWKHGADDFLPKFSTTKTWEQLRSCRDREGWSGVVS